MRHRRKQDDVLDATGRAAAALSGFDFGIDPDDFLFYETARLIDEDKASFESEEFRRLIDEGIRTHIEDRPEIRAALAGALRKAADRMPPATRTITMRVIHALEDEAADLTNAGALVLAFTTYVLDHLPGGTDEEISQEQECRNIIDRWRAGQTSREDAVAALKRYGRAAIGPTADLLFGATEDRIAAQTAIEVLASIRSPITARVLAHAISEPLLDEDVETAAFHVLKSSWPLARNYMLYQLRGHSHEDIPMAWFQLFVQADEPLTVDLALEEWRAHGEAPEFREDLTALAHALESCRDPELEDKILAAINDPNVPEFVQAMLSRLLQRHSADPPAEPWSGRIRTRHLNQRYRHAAALLESGRGAEAACVIDEILAEDPRHPFAAMLRALI